MSRTPEESAYQQFDEELANATGDLGFQLRRSTDYGMPRRWFDVDKGKEGSTIVVFEGIPPRVKVIEPGGNATVQHTGVTSVAAEEDGLRIGFSKPDARLTIRHNGSFSFESGE